MADHQPAAGPGPTVDSLEIHHIGILGGDATVILARYTAGGEPKTAKVLIDAGGEGGDDGTWRLGAYLTAVLGGLEFDFVIASHYHADHIAGFARLAPAFREVIDIGGYPVGNQAWQHVNLPARPGGMSQVVADYGKYVADRLLAGARRRELPFVNRANFANGVLGQAHRGPVTIDLVPGAQPPVTLTCFCAGGVLADGTNVLRMNVRDRVLGGAYDVPGQAQQDTLDKKIERGLALVNPNDHSLAFVLEWEGFRYFTAGDLSGDLSLKRYANIEEPLVEYLAAQGKLPVTVMKVNHHGSDHSTYPAQVEREVGYVGPVEEDAEPEAAPACPTSIFKAARGVGLLDELRPQTIVVPCNQMKGVPGGECLDRLRAHCEKQEGAVYFVNQCDYPPPGKARQKASTEAVAGLRPYSRLSPMPGGTTSRAVHRQEDGTVQYGDMPRAVVVRPIRPGAVPGIVLEEGVIEVLRRTHAVRLDFRGYPDDMEVEVMPSGGGRSTIPRAVSTPKRESVYEQCGDRAREILRAMGRPDAGIGWVQQNFPSLVERVAGVDTLRFPDAAGLAAVLREVFARCYPVEHPRGEYAASNAVTPYECVTTKSLLAATPDAEGHWTRGEKRRVDAALWEVQQEMGIVPADEEQDDVRPPKFAKIAVQPRK